MMLSPKEKAIELVDKFRNKIISFLSDNQKDQNAKQCALIAVNEILEYTKRIEYIGTEFYLNGVDMREKIVVYDPYYLEVKQEIEKL